MSSSVFPSLPGLDVEVSRESIYKTTIHQSISGKEDRASWESSPRYRYSLKFNVLRTDVMAPAPWNGQSEAATVIQFLDDHKGVWDSFLFTDPYDGVQRRVRFAADTLRLCQVIPTIWTAEFELLSVK